MSQPQRGKILIEKQTTKTNKLCKSEINQKKQLQRGKHIHADLLKIQY